MKKKILMMSVFTFVIFAAAAAFAQEGGHGAEGAKFFDYALLAAGFGMALATFGGALAQGRTAAAAMEGIARNPGASGNMFLPFILGLALIESLVIYSLIIMFMIQGKM